MTVFALGLIPYRHDGHGGADLRAHQYEGLIKKGTEFGLTPRLSGSDSLSAKTHFVPIPRPKVVMAGPAEGRVPATHVLRCSKKDLDGRDKHGHDDEKESRSLQPSCVWLATTQLSNLR
jgi:hypothetical protein